MSEVKLWRWGLAEVLVRPIEELVAGIVARPDMLAVWAEFLYEPADVAEARRLAPALSVGLEPDTADGAVCFLPASVTP